MAWIHVVVDVPREVERAAARFWSSALGWPLGEPWSGHPELRSFEPPEGAPYVHLQVIDGPSRVHPDLEADDPDALVEAAVASGAVLVGTFEQWRTLRSPGGLPFCVLRAKEREAPDPVTWGDGHRSRMVQVCVDVPSEALETEVAFWQQMLDGDWAGSSLSEFVGTWHDDAGSPLQLLFQRLDEPTGPVRAHLDQGTDNLAAEVRRLADLGAADAGAGRSGWHVLCDPAGMPFCVTENSPELTRGRDLG